MNSDVIKSFMVGLGFDVDSASLEKFNKAIESAALKITALYVSIQLTAAGIFKGISDISEGFEKMGYEYRLIAPAISKTLELRKAMLDAYSRAGINILQAVQQSVKFNFSLAKTKMAFEAIYKSVGVKFLPTLTKQMDIFRTKIYANMPKIQAALGKFVAFIFKAFQATVHLGQTLFSILGRVWDFFKKLDEATNGWSTIILGLVAAWKLLNLSFLATPLGILLVGLLGILALFDDFKTWKEGGKSLFDWSYALPIINAIEAGLETLWGVVVKVTKAVALIWGNLLTGNLDGFFQAFIGYGNTLVGVFSTLWDLIKTVVSGLGGLTGVVSAVGSGLKGVAQSIGGSLINFGSSKSDNSIPAVLGGAGASSALKGATQPNALAGGQQAGNVSHQNVNQETNINIQGSPDAHATAKSVSNEQGKVNFDMTRNLKGATR